MAARGQKKTLGQKMVGQLNQTCYVNEIFLSDVFFSFTLWSFNIAMV